MHKTAWKDSEARDGRPPNWLREGDEIHEMASPWLRWVHRPQDVFHMIYDPSYLRVMMVRNPYSRLLSAFLDKACTPINGYWAGIQKLIGGLYQPTPEDFQRFIVRLLYLKSRNPRDRHLGSEPHFTPLTTHCGIDAGVQYDLILKVEEIDMWYPDIVHILGLQEHVGSGWDANPRQDPPVRASSLDVSGGKCCSADRVEAHLWHPIIGLAQLTNYALVDAARKDDYDGNDSYDCVDEDVAGPDYAGPDYDEYDDGGNEGSDGSDDVGSAGDDDDGVDDDDDVDNDGDGDGDDEDDAEEE